MSEQHRLDLDDEFDHQGDVATEFMRRGFMKWLVGGVTALYAAAFSVPVYRFLRSGNVDEGGVQVTQITLNSAFDLEVGAHQMFRFGSKPAMIIRQAEDEFHAFLATCTHLGCTVAYNRPMHQITCACHGGKYDPVTGKNIAGPPPKPLTALKTEVMDGDLVVKI